MGVHVTQTVILERAIALVRKTHSDCPDRAQPQPLLAPPLPTPIAHQRSQTKATLSLTSTSSADGGGCTHHPTEEVSRCLLLTLRVGQCCYWETPSNSGV